MKEKIETSEVWNTLKLRKDNGGRWIVTEGTPQSVIEYLKHYRTPSRGWPLSYFKALLTNKFLKYLEENDVTLYNSLDKEGV